MTVLAFSIAAKRYGIAVRDVIQVIPIPPLRPLDLAPASIAGVFRFRGALVPVIDLCLMHGSGPAPRAFGTRVIIVGYTCGDDESRPIGLLAEGVTDIVDYDDATVQLPVVATPDAPWLGSLVPSRNGPLMQMIDVDQLLSDELRGALFPRPAEPKA